MSKHGQTEAQSAKCMDRTVTRHPHAEQHIIQELKQNLGPAGSNGGFWVEVQPNGELDENGNAVWSITGGRDV